MHPSQARAIYMIERGVTHLTDKLLEEFDVDEADALEVVRNLPGLRHELQHGGIESLYEVARKNFVGKVNLPDNPKEYYPGHPSFQSPLTTKDKFNEHMADAMEPYVMAIAKKVAKDRGIQPPNEMAIKRELQRMDWAKAAYEAKRMGKKPPPGRVRQFFAKWVFRPLGKLIDLPIEQIFGLLGASSVMWIMWSTFHERLAEIGSPLTGTLNKTLDLEANWRTNKFMRKYGKRWV
jgi:hypothetical protein